MRDQSTVEPCMMMESREQEEGAPPVATVVVEEPRESVEVENRYFLLEDRTRAPHRMVLNLAWLLVGGGLAPAIIYLVLGELMVCTVVLSPFGGQLLKLSSLCFAPFGKLLFTKSPCAPCSDSRDCRRRSLEMLGNILWFPFGLVICVIHLVFAFVCFLSIIGIPFATQHWKLVRVSLMPFSTFDDGGLSLVENFVRHQINQPVVDAVMVHDTTTPSISSSSSSSSSHPTSDSHQYSDNDDYSSEGAASAFLNQTTEHEQLAK